MSGNILLIGGTEFLGAHIAYEFLVQNTGDIYFLIDEKDNIPIRYRLLQSLRLYFEDSFLTKMDSRIKVIKGDIAKNISLGVSHGDLLDIVQNVSTVINSADFAKDFVDNEIDENENHIDIKNIISFCTKYGKRFLHISTLSISGYLEKDEMIVKTPENINDNKIFNENNLYIGQRLTDIYDLSKFEAEIRILEAIYDGLDAQVLRVGNITGRYLDGVCHPSIKSSTFAKKLKSFIEIGAFPKYLLEHDIDFTPVDLAANAIVTILNHTSDCNMFHITETKKLPISMFTHASNTIGIDIVPVSNRLMNDIINGILVDDSRKHIVSNIMHDLNYDRKLVYTSSIKLVNSFTEDYLRNCGFRWKKLDKNYIFKFLNYLKKIGFISF